MIFVSYYTFGNYEKVFKEYLEPSLKRWNLKYDVETIEDLGNWQKNTHIKAEKIKQMMLKYKQSIVYLDVDATIEQFPLLLEKLCLFSKTDIALHKLDWYKLWRKQEGNPMREFLSGTLYLAYNDKVLKFLDKWIEENKNYPNNLEQRNMQKVLEKRGSELNIYYLPPEYCAIKKRDGTIPTHYVTEKVVILHHQVSRKYKR